MNDKTATIIPGEEVKTTLSKSEQRKKNRQDNKGSKKSDSSGEPSVGFFARIFNFFVEAKEELAKVVWPTRKETVDTTWRLLVLVALAGLYLGLVDSVLTWLLGFII
ncbi:MAG: preprotein translocase subunit SecE [Candidatus Adiutrix sp.]|jgi:preprotein translocase subunit SecE|nr:preprotein translocase subunit SecE [Candidatus Adiutrix sp.]